MAGVQLRFIFRFIFLSTLTELLRFPIVERKVAADTALSVDDDGDKILNRDTADVNCR